MTKKITALLMTLIMLVSVSVYAEEDIQENLGLPERYHIKEADRYYIEPNRIGYLKDGTFFDYNDTKITEQKFRRIGQFADGLAPAMSEYSNQYGYINEKGVFVLPPIYGSDVSFSDGLALVRFSEDEKDERSIFAFINTKGEIVYQVPDGQYASPFQNGVSTITRQDGENGQIIRVVDTKFKTVFETNESDYIESLSEEYFYSMKIPSELSAENMGHPITKILDRSGKTFFEIPDAVVQLKWADGKFIGSCVKDDKQCFMELALDGTLKINEAIQCREVRYINKDLYAIHKDEDVIFIDANLNEISRIKDAYVYDIQKGFFSVNSHSKQKVYFVIDTQYQEPEYEKIEYQPIDIERPVSPSNTYFTFKIEDYRSSVDGEVGIMRTGGSAKTFIKNGRTMVPTDAFSRTVYYDIDWNGDDIRIFEKDSSVDFKIGSTQAKIAVFDNSRMEYIVTTVQIDTAPEEIGDTVYIPVRAFAELLNKYIYYDERGLVCISNQEIDFEHQKDDMLADYDAMMSLDEYPRIDGSTATIPFSQALTKKVLGISDTNAVMLTNHTRTTNSYKRLLNREVDFVIGALPSEEVLQMAEEAGVEMEIYTFAKEGFVFLLNKDNPVDNLTIEQIQDIYQGKITNWKELGGTDTEIIPFQRNEASGSQVIMKTIVMQGKEMMEPKTETINAMGEIVDMVAEFDNAKDSIGYSVYYYFTEMYGNQQVKIPAVNGIQPTQETISTGEYPFVTDYCIAIRKDEPEGSAVRRLLEFVKSDAGKQLITDTHFINAVS